MLLAGDIGNCHSVTLGQLRQRRFARRHVVIRAFLIHRGEARKLLVFAIEAHSNAIAADFHRHRFVEGGHHLARQEAVVNQLIEVVLLLRQRRLDAVRRAVDVGRADGFMRVLRVLAPLVLVRLLRQIVAAETLRDVLAQGIQGFIRNANAVRTDVADNTLRALAFKVNAFVELLDNLHRLCRREAQFSAGFLLQRGRRERCGRHLALFAHFDAVDRKMCFLNAFDCFLRFFRVGNHRFLPVERGKARREVQLAPVRLMRQQLGGNLPVFLRDKRLDFFLAHHHHARRDGLHAAGGKPLLNLRPQQRADFIADETIQHTACLLRVHAPHIHRTGGLQRVLNRLFRHLVKLNAARLAWIHVQHMAQMP